MRLLIINHLPCNLCHLLTDGLLWIHLGALAWDSLGLLVGGAFGVLPLKVASGFASIFAGFLFFVTSLIAVVDFLLFSRTFI